MITPATFADDEVKIIEELVNGELGKIERYLSFYTLLNDKKVRDIRIGLTSIRNKCWAQIHGTEATDVEGV